MKLAQLTAFGVVLGLTMAAGGKSFGETPLTMPSSVQQTAYDYDYYNAPEEGASTEAAAPAEGASTAGNACPQTVCRLHRDESLGEPWTIPQPAALKNRGITVGGWLEGGIYGNQYGNANNGPVGMRPVGDGFTADQVWFFAERKTDTKGCGWDVGGRVDYLFGADGPDTQCFGDNSFDYNWDTSDTYGSAMPQLYGEIAYNDLKVKMGHFFTPIGYEVVPATANFFYSHSYCQVYGEPFTHTGALAEYSVNENVKIYNGWVNGWDEGFETRNNGSMYLGGVALTLSEKTSLAWYCTAGRIGDGDAFVGAATGDEYMNSVVYTYKFTDKWTYVFQGDLGTNYNVDVTGAGDNQWYGVSNYLFYKATERLSYGGRFEWFQDPQGVKVYAGNPGNYYELTAGFNYKPRANISIRPEVRYDFFNAFDGAATPGPFNGGTADNQVSFGTDFIFTF